MGEREIGNTFIFTQTTQPLQTNRDFSAYFKTNIHCTLNSVTTRQSKFIVGDIEENYDLMTMVMIMTMKMAVMVVMMTIMILLVVMMMMMMMMTRRK